MVLTFPLLEVLPFQTNQSNGVTSVKYNVPDMSCGHCKASIEKAIETLDPAASVVVDLEAKTIDVSTRKPPTVVLATLADIGFPALPA